MTEFYESPFESNPYDTSTGLARRASGRPVGPSVAVAAAGQTDLVDPDAGNWVAETARSLAQSTGNDFTNGLEFLGRGLLGDEEGRVAAGQEYLAEQDRARRMGPAIQSFEDASAAGGGVGNYGAALGYMAAGLLPDIVATATGVGTAGTLARRGVRKGIQRSIADGIEADAGNAARRSMAASVARSDARAAATTAGGGPEAVSGAVRVATAQVNEASRKAAMAEAAKIAGRTPRYGIGADTAEEALTRTRQEAIDRAGDWAGRAGGTVAAIPGLNGSANAEKAADEDTTTADMWTLAAGTTAAAATQVVPVERFLKRFGPAARSEVAAKAERFLPRATREALTQGAYEGTQEVVQQALQNASHAWVEENLGTFIGPKAFDQYLTSFIAGGVLGATMGGGAESTRALGGGLRSAAGWSKDKTSAAYQSVREKVAAAAQARRDRQAKRGFNPGDPMPPDGAPGDAPMPGGTGGAGEYFKRGMDAAKGFGTKASSKATEIFNKARDQFKQNDDLDLETDLVARDVEDLNSDVVDQLYSDAVGGQVAPISEPEARALRHPAIQDMSPLGRTLAAHLGDDLDIPGAAETAKPWIQSAEKLFTNQPLTQADEDNIDLLADLIPDAVRKWRLAGKNYADMIESTGAARVRAEAPDGDVSLTGPEAFAETGRGRGVGRVDPMEGAAARELMQAAQPGAVNEFAETDVDGGSFDDSGQGYDGMAVGRRATEQQMPTDPISALTTIPRVKGEPNYEAAKTRAQEYLFGGALKAMQDSDDPLQKLPGGNASRVLKENPTNPFFEEALKRPGVVQIEGFQLNNGSPRRRAVDLGNMMLFVQANSDVPLSKRALLLETIKQMQLSDLPIKLNAGVVPGPIKRIDPATGKATGPMIAMLKQEDIAALSVPGNAPVPAGKWAKNRRPPQVALDENKKRRALLRDESARGATLAGPNISLATIKKGDETLRRGLKLDNSDAKRGENEVEPISFDQVMGGGIREVEYAQGPRAGTPSAVNTAGGNTDLVSTTAGVFDVKVRTPYASTIKQARAQVRKGVKTKRKDEDGKPVYRKMTPAERLAVVREAGVKIGVAELNKLRKNDAISDANYKAQIQELTLNTKTAVDYWKKAAAGDLDPAPSVSETKTMGSDVKYSVPEATKAVTDDLRRVAQAMANVAKDYKEERRLTRLSEKMSASQAAEFVAEARAAFATIKLTPQARMYLRARNEARAPKSVLDKGLSKLGPKSRLQVELSLSMRNLDALTDFFPSGHPLREAIEAGRMETALDRKAAAYAQPGGMPEVVSRGVPLSKAAAEADTTEAAVAISKREAADTPAAKKAAAPVVAPRPADPEKASTRLNENRAKQAARAAARKTTDKIQARAAKAKEAARDAEAKLYPTIRTALDAAIKAHPNYNPELARFEQSFPVADLLKSVASFDARTAAMTAEQRTEYDAKVKKAVLAAADRAGQMGVPTDGTPKTSDNYPRETKPLRGTSNPPGGGKGLNADSGARPKVGDEATIEEQRRNADTRAGRTEVSRAVNKALRGPKKDITEMSQADDLGGAADAAASTPPGEHDLQAEQDMLNSVLDAMGIETKITVISAGKLMPDKGGTYNRSALTIAMNDNLKGAERVETLMHELGHHIVWNEAAKYAGGGWDALREVSTLQDAFDLIEKGNPKLYAALKADFDAFLAKHPVGSRKADALADRKPLRRAMRAQDAGAMDRGQVGEKTFTGASGFHEWIADHIARALTTQKKPVGMVAKFFGDIATQIRSLWNKLPAAVRKNYLPAKSVDKWVRDMFNAEAAAMEATTGSNASREDVEAVTRTAMIVYQAPDRPGDFSEPIGPQPAFKIEDVDGFKAAVRTMMESQERQILTRALSTAAAIKTIRQRINDMHANDPATRDQILKDLDSATDGMENRIAIGYMLWQKGLLRVGPNSTSVLHGLTDDLLSFAGLAGDGEYAQRIFSDIANGTIQRVKAAGRTYDVRKLEARSRGKTQAALDAVRSAYDKATEPLSKVFSSQLQRMRESGLPSMARLASMLARSSSTTGDDEGMNAAIVDNTARFMRQTSRILEPLSVRQRVKVLSRMQRQMKPDGKQPQIDAAMNALRGVFDQAYDYMKAAGVDVGARENFFPVVFDQQNQRAATVLNDLYMTKEKDADGNDTETYRYEKQIREFFAKTQAARERDRDDVKPADAPAKDMPAADPAALAWFERERKSWSERVAATNESIIDAIKVGSIANLRKQIAASEAREARRENVSADLERAFATERRYMKARIKQLEEAGFAENEGGATKRTGPAKAAKETPFEELVQNLVDGALNDGDQIRKPGTAPGFRGAKFRASQFIYDRGDAADIKKFASIQSKAASEIFARYFEPMVKHAEFTKRLGGGKDNRDKFDALIADLKAEGATPAQIEEAENAVAAAMGAYGVDGSPVLRMISPSLADKFSGPKTKAAVQSLQAYQNLRLLPLSLLSSLVDPMGIAVRTGGDFGLAWEGFKTGIKGVLNGTSRDDQLAMLEMLGSAEDMLPALAAGAGFSGQGVPAARKVNDFVFQANGMQRWVMATRFMAVQAGHAFLLKHAAQAATSDTSRRYLAELNIDPADIKEVWALPSAGGGAARRTVEMNDKTRAALSRFVNDAILRPHSQQVPLWYNDPYVGLLTQYKGFLYALYDQIGGRIGRELDHGNMRVVLPTLAYVPVVILAELLRELLQYGFEGNPRREDWGPGDYTWLGVQRSGLMGPKYDVVQGTVADAQAGRMVGSSQLGPTVGQAKNLVEAASGRRSISQEFENALPFNPAYKNRINPLSMEIEAPVLPFNARN